MSEITQNVPKHPTNADETLDEVLNDIVQRNGANRKLVRYDIQSTQVVLTYTTP